MRQRPQGTDAFFILIGSLFTNLVSLQREALERNYCEVLVSSLQVILNGHLAVLDELLVEQARLM